MNSQKGARNRQKPKAGAAKAAIVPPATQRPAFPVVGIGASAGGLEALEIFFSHAPAGCNIAFVVVQHLDPKHKSIMASLLARCTKMEIAEITDGMAIEKNRVYLAPSDHTIAIIDNTLHYKPFDIKQFTNLPIDFFFRSLAADKKEKAVGVILSGTGSDGTQGLRAIKGAGGMVMAQLETQAKFSGMPKSAIDTGLVDFVLPVEEMPGKIIKFTEHPYLKMQAMEEKRTQRVPGSAMEKILLLVRGKTGHDFSLYKLTTMERRIERRMALHQIEKLADYERFLERNALEVEALFREFLINVTGFFRDPKAFAALEKTALPGLMERKAPETHLRVWTPGCSTGEEAYSLAMLLTEVMEKHKKHFTLQIFASDIDDEAIETGRRAVYPESACAEVSKERLARFFVKEGPAYRIKKQIRETVVFAMQDLARDPPFSRLDLISCRNVLIYMENALQKKILSTFQNSLLENGVLFLGTSETVGGFAGSFSTVDTKFKIYRRIGSPVMRAEYPKFPEDRPAMQPGNTYTTAAGQYRALGEKMIAQNFGPPSVLINDKLEVLYSFGPIDRYLAVAPGEPSNNFLRITREGLRHKLGPALSMALSGTEAVTCENVRVGGNGNLRTADVVIAPVAAPGEQRKLLLVVFKEKARLEAPEKQARRADKTALRAEKVEALELELKATREFLQETTEEVQTSNEEFQSTNEELQSTNEELETSKEELQSTNEELVTVNSELQHKVDQLIEATNDVNNLLVSTEIASLFLDMDLRIKRFTPAMVKIFPLLQSDVGRSILDITSNVATFNIYLAAADVLGSLSRREAEAQSDDGRWFTIRIVPYRTMDNAIEGVVITLADITALKTASQNFEQAKQLAEGIVETIAGPFAVLDGDLKVLSINSPFSAFFRVKPGETLHRRIYDLGNGQWNIPQLRKLLEEILPKNTTITGYAVEHAFPVIGRKRMLLNARRIPQTNNILLAFEDVTKDKVGK